MEPSTPAPDTEPRFGRRHALGLLATAGISAAAVSVVHARGVAGLGAHDRELNAVSGPSTSSPATSASSTTAATADLARAKLAALGRVVVIGDSITYISAAAIKKKLAAVKDLTVDGRFGFTIEQQMPDAGLLAMTKPDVVVINLGTNDADLGLSKTDSAQQMDSMLELFPLATRAVVTVNTHFGTDDCRLRAQAINDHIRSRGVTVIDWDAAMGDEIAAGLPDGPMTTDTIHPTVLGQRILAGLIADGLRSTLPA